MLSLKRSFETLKKNIGDHNHTPDLILHHDESLHYYNRVDKAIQYYCPTHTGRLLHASEIAIIAIMGPFNSAKTTDNLWKLVKESTKQEKCIDGVRRAAYAVIRNTYNELKHGILRTWEVWLGGLGTVIAREQPLERTHIFFDDKGRIELTFFFISCDSESDVRKLLSVDLTGGLINECREMPRAILTALLGRWRRYPSDRIRSHPIRGFIGMDTNPPDTDNWFYQLFEIERPDNALLLMQPAGLLQIGTDERTGRKMWRTNPEADNIAHIDANYYIDQAKIAPDDEYIDVHCNGKWGRLRRGKPVFPMYSDNLHSIAKIQLKTDKDKTQIYIGWDFGYITPACVIGQYQDGFLEIVKEFIGDYISVDDLVKNAVLPWLNTHYAGFAMVSTGDPSDRNDAGSGNSCIEILERYGLSTYKAMTNALTPRLNAVSEMLGRLVNGKPVFTLCRSGAPILRKSIHTEYLFDRLQIIGSTQLKDTPTKIHPWSDAADALQYLCMRITSDIRVTSTSMLNPYSRVQKIL